MSSTPKIINDWNELVRVVDFLAKNRVAWAKRYMVELRNNYRDDSLRFKYFVKLKLVLEKHGFQISPKLTTDIFLGKVVW